MERITITEALSEINLIKKKLETKKAKIRNAIAHPKHMPDPFQSEGGSTKMIDSEMQSMRDLSRRLAKIRAQVSAVNLGNEITLGEDTRTIHDWLVWKRELAKDQLSFVQSVATTVKGQMDQAAKQPQVYKDADGVNQLVHFSFNVDYADWVNQHAKMEEKFEQLDGKLSLKNATLTIEI